MKITQMIKELKAVKKTEGDLDIYYVNQGCFDEVEIMKLDKTNNKKVLVIEAYY